MNAMRRLGRLGVVAVALVSASDLSAHPTRHRHVHLGGTVRPVPPSADSIELAGIAPPARRSTVLGTYGDAAIARAQAQQGDANGAERDTPPYPCDPRVAEARGYLCANTDGRRGYGQGYAFTPAYVSAPQVVGDDLAVQTPILPPVTGLLWALNGLRVDPH